MAYAWSVSGHVATRSTRVSRPEDHQEVKGQGNQEKTPPGGSADLLWSSARLSGQDEQRRGSPGTVSPHTSEKNKTNICFDRMNFILTVSCRLQLDDVWAESGPWARIETPALDFQPLNEFDFCFLLRWVKIKILLNLCLSFLHVRLWSSLMCTTSKRIPPSLLRAHPGIFSGYCSPMEAHLKMEHTNHPVSLSPLSMKKLRLNIKQTINQQWLSVPCRWRADGGGVFDGWPRSGFSQGNWRTSCDHRLQQHPRGGWSQESQTGLTRTKT